MAIYLIPKAVAKRIAKKLEPALAALGGRMISTETAGIIVHYTADERAAFGTEDPASLFLAVEDADAFEAMVPETYRKKRSYKRLRNDKALRKLDPFYHAAS